MGGKNKKQLDRDKNRRLDVFLETLEIKKEKRQQILDYVEDLTFDTLKNNQRKQLRLNK